MGLQEPVAPNRQTQFGHVRSARSVFASSTEVFCNSLIQFDFFNHRSHHRHPRFGQRFGIENLRKLAGETSLQIFNLRAIQTGVPRAVNP
jgi:hypothetical protein